jgi:hypothetical protein
VDQLAPTGLANYQAVVDEISRLPWATVTAEEMMLILVAYWGFSVQFRESLHAARRLFPDDLLLVELETGECDTDNLSPWPDIAAPGERMNHDEFMRRVIRRSVIPENDFSRAMNAVRSYLLFTGAMPEDTQARSIASYECGGLEQVFKAILRAECWDANAALQAFRHFLEKHISFDSDPDGGHGALIRHLQPDERTVLMWEAFRDLFTTTVPRLAN